MPLFLFALIIRLTIDVAAFVRKRRTSRRYSRCMDCSHAHVQYATNGRTAIACTFAGGVRPVGIDVMYCTDYHDRNAPPRVFSVGFAAQIRQAEPVTEVAMVNLEPVSVASNS
jgi:hypothetical protein